LQLEREDEQCNLQKQNRSYYKAISLIHINTLLNQRNEDEQCNCWWIESVKV